MILVRWMVFVLTAWLVIVLVLALVGCTPTIEYRTIPAWLIPAKPTVTAIPAKQLACLSDETYIQLAGRDRACWQYARELRALLGPEPQP